MPRPTDDKRARFEALVLPHLDSAYRFARALTRSAADAGDVLQEAVLRAFRGFEQLRGTNVKAWLLTIVRNCHRTVQRTHRERPLVPWPDEAEAAREPALWASDDPEQDALAADRTRELVKALMRLSEEHREVLILREIEDLDYREMAAVLATPLGTVMSRLSRARAALRQRWMENEVMPCP
jgi:RNA polymerase sigma-70 factor (ECF subfamily)